MSFLLRRLVLIAPLLLAAAPLAAEEPSTAETERVQRIVRDYLQQHPEVIIEAIKSYQDKRAAAEAGKARQTISALQDELLRDPASPVGANPAGDVSIVEFFDYRCPYCKAVAPDLAKALAADGKVRLIYKEFPILGSSSMLAAKAALASQQQGKYIPFHEKLIAFKGNLDEVAIYAMAADIGLDVAKLKSDMQKPEIDAAIQRNYKLADKLAIQGTPAFVIGSELLPGAASVDELTAAIRRARSGG